MFKLGLTITLFFLEIYCFDILYVAGLVVMTSILENPVDMTI